MTAVRRRRFAAAARRLFKINRPSRRELEAEISMLRRLLKTLLESPLQPTVLTGVVRPRTDGESGIDGRIYGPQSGGSVTKITDPYRRDFK